MVTRKTVVIVAHDIGGRGGMERHLEELISRLKRDADVIAVASTLKLADQVGVRFIRIPVIRRPAFLRYILFAIIASIRLLFVKRDVLHTTGAVVFNQAQLSTVHFCHAGYVAATGGSRARHSHSSLRRLNNWFATQVALVMERIIYRPQCTLRLIAVSNRVKAELLTYFPYDEHAILTIPNGVDSERFRIHSPQEKQRLRAQEGFPDKATLLLFMGGDWPLKGLEHVLQAFRTVAEHFPSLHLVVVGTGDEAEYRKSVVVPQQQRVHFVGSKDNPESWFGMSDIFIFPSSYETFSLVVHEAAATGLIILATEVGGVEELIEHGVNGFFIQSNRNDIARRLESLVVNIEAFRNIGYRARDKIRDLTWDDMYAKLAEAYHFTEIQPKRQDRGKPVDYSDVSARGEHGAP